jgi:hypothetical protein
MVRELKHVGQMQDVASKAYNYLRVRSHTILSLVALEQVKDKQHNHQTPISIN